MLSYLCGLLAWNQTFQLIAATFTTNAELFGRVYFPRLVVPLSIVLSNLIAFFIEAAILGVFWIYYKFFTAAGVHFGTDAVVLLVPFLLVQVAAVSAGAALIVTSCTAKYCDLRHVLPRRSMIGCNLAPRMRSISLARSA